MSPKRLVGIACLPALLVCGCAGLSQTENGALAGGAIGAGTGAVVGDAVGNTGAGALIGAGVGALSGALVGNAVEKSERRAEAAAVAAHARALGITDVAQMAQQQISDDVIIGQIRATGSIYQLTPNDIYWLKQNGVSDAVVREMQITARYPRRVYAAAPVYAPAPVCGPAVYVVEPPPPPLHIGFGYHHHRRHGHW